MEPLNNVIKKEPIEYNLEKISDKMIKNFNVEMIVNSINKNINVSPK